MRKIPQIEPWLDQKEIDQVTDVIRSTWLVEGDKTRQLEEEFAGLVQCRYAIAVCNATAGLYCCLKALGIGADHEVILPDLTFIATANSVIWAGAQPVLADIDPDTLNIDPRAIEEKITDRTRAIMPVHLYGKSADMESIRAIAERNELAIIEDAAQSVGVKFKGQHVGSFGNMGCFSFYGNKTITTGQGGMITTNDVELKRRCLILKNHGRVERGTFIHDHIGYNFCFTDLQAALGLAQMMKLDQILNRKRDHCALYRKLLADVPGLDFPRDDPCCQTVPWFTNIFVDDAETLSHHLAAANIETRRFFLPLHRQPCYRGRWKEDFPQADSVYRRGLSLPSSAALTEEQVARVCQQIRQFYAMRDRP